MAPVDGELRTIDGKVYRWVPAERPVPASPAETPVFGNTDIFTWRGVYQAFDENIESTTIASVYEFGFGARQVSIYTNNNITVRLNSVSNPYITIDATESPFIFGPFYPNMLIERIFLDTKGSSTRVKILAVG